MTKRILSTVLIAVTLGTISNGMWAQRVVKYTTTEESAWKQTKVSLSNKAEGTTIISLNGEEEGVPFHAWGTTFNELDLSLIHI